MWKPIFKTTLSKHHWMPIKSIGIVPAGNQKLFRFVMAITKEPGKNLLNFQSMSRPINGFADAGVRVENPTVTDRISRVDNTYFLCILVV